jgi:hypothetical protein
MDEWQALQMRGAPERGAQGLIRHEPYSDRCTIFETSRIASPRLLLRLPSWLAPLLHEILQRRCVHGE